VEKLSVLILAGGRSRRMGQDKVWMALEGVSLVERVVRRVLPLADEFLFSTNAPERFETFARSMPVPSRVVTDLFAGAGPLAGIQAGLSAARHDLLLALAADMPFVNEALVRHLVALAVGFDAVVPQTPHPDTGELSWEPLHALYRRGCLTAIEARMAAGQRRAYCFYGDIRVRTVLPAEVQAYDPTLRSFVNVNTPVEWARIQRSVSGSGP